MPPQRLSSSEFVKLSSGGQMSYLELIQTLPDKTRFIPGLSAREFVSLKREVGIAYLASHRISDEELLEDTKIKLVRLEQKYGMASQDFYERWKRNTEKFLSGGPEEVDDFFSWSVYYKKYLQLKDTLDDAE